MKRIKKRYVFLIFICIAVITSIIHIFKPLPADVSFNGEFREVTEVEFLHDLTYVTESDNKKHEQVIFNRIFESIREAENFIVIDMFLFNDDYDRAYEFPSLSMDLSDALVKKKKEQPNMEIVFITDRINTFYGTYTINQLERMKEHGINVIETDMRKLRDSNPIYSGFWRAYFQWFGTSGFTWLPNSFGAESPSVNIRSYLELLNFKANHRKVVITEKEVIVTSGNPHDASAHHSNIGFVLKGDIIGDVLKTEKAVAQFSGNEINAEYVPNLGGNKSDSMAKVITEGQIERELLDAIVDTVAGHEIKMGMFYLSDRDVIQALKDAANRGVDVKLILDPNKDAFGIKKNGIPNRQAARELINDSKVDVRWYDTHGEQYHTKMTLIQKEDSQIVIAGSANLTKRNIGDLNLETNVMIVTKSDEDLSREIYEYFDRLWNNKNGTYTVDYSAYEDNSFLKKIMYRVQEWTGLSTF